MTEMIPYISGVEGIIIGLLVLFVQDLRHRVLDFHGRWKAAVSQRETFEQETDEELILLRATIMALEGVYDEEELEEKRKQAKKKAREDWNVRNGRASKIDFSIEAVNERMKRRGEYRY